MRLALRKFGLEPGKDVALLPTGGESEAFAALQAGSVQIAALAYPSYVHAQRMEMRELVNFSELGFEAVNAALVSTRGYLAQNRDTATRFVRALIRGMHRYRTDKEFSKRVLGKYFRSNDDPILEASWKDVAPNLLKVPAAIGQGRSSSSSTASSKIKLHCRNPRASLTHRFSISSSAAVLSTPSTNDACLTANDIVQRPKAA